MTYKILFIKNRYKKKLKLSKYFIDWFKKNTPLEIVTEEIQTDFDVNIVEVGNHKFKGVVVSKDIIAKLRTVVPENKYNAVVFIYDNDVDGIRLSCVNAEGQSLYHNTELIQLVKLNDNGKILNHETFHAFFEKLKRLGIALYDPMDTYFRDNIFDINNGETNRTMALRFLAPYWDKVCSLTPLNAPKLPLGDVSEAILTRTSSSSKQTLGTLIARKGGATFSCDTLELPWLGNQRNISCIPKGVYTCVYTFSPKFMKYTYEVKNVSGRSGIRIHIGNYFKDIQGCILLGNGKQDVNKDGHLDVINSTTTIKSFEGFMQKKPFTLVIR